VAPLGAALLAAPVSTRWAPGATLASGLTLLAIELADGRRPGGRRLVVLGAAYRLGAVLARAGAGVRRWRPGSPR
jgi:hypothetical protein